jgi:eukaryotic-like serine/threonine-protein kinase
MPTDAFSLFDLVPGKLIAGRYKILRAHRQNGLSASFEATDCGNGEADPNHRERELTIFPSALFDQAAQAEEYRQSLEPWKSVRSPHVLRVRELLVLEPSTLALVTDLPRGEPMRSWLKRHARLDGPGVRALGLQLVLALEAIHKAKLVHGDIKPHTIYVGTQATGLFAQLVDGGVTPGLWNAKHLGDRTALIGTPYYAPIEQFGGESPDVQSDIYNVATVLFEAATGVLPWPGASFLEVFQAKLDKHPPSMRRRAPNVEVDGELERAIVGGLLADRRERYRTATAFREALEAVRSP